MQADIRTCKAESPQATELYLTATASASGTAREQAAAIFSDIRDVLASMDAHILQERLFATAEALAEAAEIRAQTYGELDDGVAPSFLAATQGQSGPIAGLQVHAIITQDKPQVIRWGQIPCGRLLRLPGRSYLTLSNITATDRSGRTQQARAMLEKAEAILKEHQCSFLSVPRTWMWLGDILAWYDDFNHVRNNFFTQRGLIGPGTRQSMPASTGIGLYPADPPECAMDLVAVLETQSHTQYLQAIGKQQCALEYGSAFSRAALALTPAAETVFVSGTASIDASGATIHVGDAKGQVNATIENVRAVLTDMQTSDEDVVHAVAYCKTPDVEQIFTAVKESLPWPCVTTICDICRPDLLFEVEATAIRPTK